MLRYMEFVPENGNFSETPRRAKPANACKVHFLGTLLQIMASRNLRSSRHHPSHYISIEFLLLVLSTHLSMHQPTCNKLSVQAALAPHRHDLRTREAGCQETSRRNATTEMSHIIFDIHRASRQVKGFGFRISVCLQRQTAGISFNPIPVKMMSPASSCAGPDQSTHYMPPVWTASFLSLVRPVGN